MVPIYIPDCSADGQYKEIQHHEGTPYYWCVDKETGDVINGTSKTNTLPQCPGTSGKIFPNGYLTHQILICMRYCYQNVLSSSLWPRLTDLMFH